jgi:hypothetical protein
MSKDESLILYISLISTFYEKATIFHSKKQNLIKNLQNFKQ